MKLLPRGVYHATWLLADCPVLVAIDRHHNILDWQPVQPQDDPCAILDRLWQLLERQDPDTGQPLQVLGAPKLVG